MKFDRRRLLVVTFARTQGFSRYAHCLRCDDNGRVRITFPSKLTMPDVAEAKRDCGHGLWGGASPRACRYAGLVILCIGAVVACSGQPLEPSAPALVGGWSHATVQLSPMGESRTTLDFTADGHYIGTTEMRGIYAQLSANSVASVFRTYGTYVLTGNVLHLSQDSTRTWDFLSGSFFHAGPAGISIEGPPTDPTVEVTQTQLTLRYFVNPGDGYRPVVDQYNRYR